MISASRFLRDHGVATASVIFYFAASIGLTMFNKWFFSHAKEAPTTPIDNATDGAPVNHFGGNTKGSSYEFHFPLTVTCIHQFLVFVLLMIFRPVLVPYTGDVVRSHDALRAIGPIGALCGIDWGLSNTSLRTITLSLYEMIKSCTPLMVLILSFAFGLVAPSWRLTGIVAAISIGMFFAVSGGDIDVFKDPNFPLGGFICVLCAMGLSGVRVTLAQQVLQHHSHRLTPPASPLPPPLVTPTSMAPAGTFAAAATTPPSRANGFNVTTTLFYAAPISAVVLVLPALLVEGREVSQYWADADFGKQCGVIMWTVSSAALAFALSLAEFTVTKLTSALTLVLVGVSKQILIIVLAMIVFGDRLMPINIMGFMLTVIGIALYRTQPPLGTAAGVTSSSSVGTSTAASPITVGPSVVTSRGMHGGSSGTEMEKLPLTMRTD